MTTTPPASGAPDDTDIDGDSELAALRVGALTSQSDIDKYKNTYAALGSNYVAEQTGWDGLTKEQEEFLSRKLRERTAEEAEHDQEMEEVREQADALIAQLNEEERQAKEDLDKIKKRPIKLADGRIVEPDANGQFTTDANGRALTDAEKADAERQQKQKEADEQAKKDQLAQLDDAKASAEQAGALASQGGSNLTPEQRAEAQSKLAQAKAVAQAAAKGPAYVDVNSDTDPLAALGAAPAGRTTSFSATLDGKDSRSTVLQDQYNGAAQGAPTPPPDDQAPAGNTMPKTQIVQPNQ